MLKKEAVHQNKVVQKSHGSGYFCHYFACGHTAIPRFCIRNDDCGRCPFEQWLEEMDARLPLSLPNHIHGCSA